MQASSQLENRARAQTKALNTVGREGFEPSWELPQRILSPS